MKLRTCLLLVLVLFLLAPGLAAQDRALHLAIGDPARKDQETRLVLDGIADTRGGGVLTPAALAKQIGDVRLLLVGESHTAKEILISFRR